MAEYYFVKQDGNIEKKEYRQSMSITSQKAFDFFKESFSYLNKTLEYEKEENFTSCYKIYENDIFANTIFASIYQVTPGGRAEAVGTIEAEKEFRIQLKAKEYNYIYDKSNEHKGLQIGVYYFDNVLIFIGWKPKFSKAQPETPISTQVSIDDISMAVKYGFHQVKNKSGNFVCLCKKEVLPFYIKNSDWLHYESIKNMSNYISTSTPSTQTPTQIIFYGVPGSGKSHSIKNELVKKGITDLKEQTKRVVFHPEYTNADFVGQILPQSSDSGKTISYPFVPGPFTQILAKAYTHKNTHYALIIEEINRGNAAAIFGELFQLLDRLDEDETESSNEKSYETGWSSYPINNDNINKAIQEGYEKFKTDSKFKPFIDKEKFDTYKLNIGIRLPPNLSIFATMNTSDQNVFKLDNAFKRRLELKLIPNKFNNEPKEINQRDAVVEGFDFTWNNFREAVNSIIIDPDNSIDISSFADRQIGCWFAKAIKKDEKYIIEKEVFVHKVLEYLWDDVCNGDIGIFFNENYKSFAELVEDIIENDSTDIFSENLKGKLSQNKPE